MKRNNFASTTLNLGSPNGSSEVKGRVLFADSPDEGSPSKMSCHQDNNTGSPVRGIPFFGSPDKGSCHQDDTGSPVRGNLFFGSPDEESPFKRPRPYENVSESDVVVSPPQCFTVNLGSPVPITPLAVSLPDFLQAMASRHASVLSPISVTKPKSVEKKVGSGSYASVFKLDDRTVRKVYKLGKTKGQLNNRDLWKQLSAFSRSHGNPQFASINDIAIVQTDNSWEMHVEQEMCSPLRQEHVLGYVRCIISMLNQYLPLGQGEVSPKDVKRFNFGLNADGNVVCIDINFTNYKIGKVPYVVSSGEFQHGEHTMLMSFVLTILDFFETTRSDFRKDDFKLLNYTSGILKKWGLLSSDRSVSEIDVKDFCEILRSIKPSNGEEPLSDDEINRLVWFLTPESQ